MSGFTEDVSDDNLDETLDVAKRLKGLALVSGQEVETQNDRLGKISTRTEQLDTRIERNVQRQKRLARH